MKKKTDQYDKKRIIQIYTEVGLLSVVRRCFNRPRSTCAGDEEKLNRQRAFITFPAVLIPFHKISSRDT
jgi:hypothetical protein